jgi:hypothetical protein
MSRPAVRPDPGVHRRVDCRADRRPGRQGDLLRRLRPAPADRGGAADQAVAAAQPGLYRRAHPRPGLLRHRGRAALSGLAVPVAGGRRQPGAGRRDRVRPRRREQPIRGASRNQHYASTPGTQRISRGGRDQRSSRYATGVPEHGRSDPNICCSSHSGNRVAWSADQPVRGGPSPSGADIFVAGNERDR